MSIGLKNINDLTPNEPNSNDKLAFGKPNVTELFSTTFQEVFNKFGGASSVQDISYKVEEIVDVLIDPQPSLALNFSITLAKGEIGFVKVNVLNGDSLGLDTYLVKKGEGTHSGLLYSDLLRVNREEGDLSNTVNTVTYIVTSLNEINEADPEFDFSDENLVYFVNLDGLLYRFIGVNGFYGNNALQISMNDLVLVGGADDVIYDSFLNINSTNGVENQAITKEFIRTNFEGINFNFSINTQQLLLSVNYKFLNKVDSNTSVIECRQDAPSDFNIYGQCTEGSINVVAQAGIDLIALNGPTIQVGESFHLTKLNDNKTYVLVKFARIQAKPKSLPITTSGGVIQADLSNFATNDYTDNLTDIENINVVNTQLGGIALIRGNWENKPTITGATEYGVTNFVSDAEMLLTIEVIDFGVKYYYLEI